MRRIAGFNTCIQTSPLSRGGAAKQGECLNARPCQSPLDPTDSCCIVGSIIIATTSMNSVTNGLYRQ